VFLVLEAFQSLAAERSGHVTPRDLCTALREAVDEQSLRECKLLTGEDVGRIVLAAVESRLLNVREGESETDYAGLYALDRE
jgi:hypothetical protein